MKIEELFELAEKQSHAGVWTVESMEAARVEWLNAISPRNVAELCRRVMALQKLSDQLLCYTLEELDEWDTHDCLTLLRYVHGMARDIEATTPRKTEG